MKYYQKNKSYWVLLFVVSLFTVIGCGEDTKGRRGVAGKITLDGKDVDGASVTFTPVDQPGTSDVTVSYTVSEKGSYLIEENDRGLVPGDYSVKVSLQKTMNAKGETWESTEFLAKVPKGYVSKEIIPNIYNTKTTLRTTIKPKGKNVFDIVMTTP